MTSYYGWGYRIAEVLVDERSWCITTYMSQGMRKSNAGSEKLRQFLIYANLVIVATALKTSQGKSVLAV